MSDRDREGRSTSTEGLRRDFGELRATHGVTPQDVGRGLRTALGVMLAFLIAVPVAGAMSQPATSRHHVSAWTFGARTSLRAADAAGAIDEVQVCWYSMRSDGALVADSVDPTYVALAHALGCRVLATVDNWASGRFSAALAHAVLTSPAARERLTSALADACSAVGYDGVDLDIESVRPIDRDLLSALVRQVAQRLHADGRLLAFAAAAKTSDAGGWWGAASEDYAQIGATVDEFQVMTYAYSGEWSGPGPIAPPAWVGHVLDYAQSQVPAAKLWMGLPFYGIEWSRGGLREITWRQARRMRSAHHAHLVRTRSGEASFTFRDHRGRHTVYYQDRDALTAKLAVLTRDHPGVAGVAIWVMGGEDPRFWPELATRL